MAREMLDLKLNLDATFFQRSREARKIFEKEKVRIKGLTLIEFMIGVATIGILAVTAYSTEKTHVARPSTRRRANRRQPCLFFMLLMLLAGCASTQHQSRPFFVNEQELETHGRKTWLDRLIEADPGSTVFKLANDYQTHPPRKIAVLPFADKGDGVYLINRLPFADRNEGARDRWSWTHTNRLRRSVTGALATREFIIVPLPAVDAVLADHGITDWDKLNAVPPEELGRWLDADAVVYGKLLSYEAYYGFLIAAWQVSANVRMVSTVDGHEIFSCTDHRYSTNVNLVFDPIDIAINSVLSLIQLRDIWLARTEYEVGHEIILRLPTAQGNISELQAAAKEGLRRLDSSSSQATAMEDPVRMDLLSAKSVSPFVLDLHH
jgi:hypothetical protein